MMCIFPKTKFIVLFPVRKITGQAADGSNQEVEVLHGAEVEKSSTYRFEDEDPSIYSDDEDYAQTVTLPRAFPKQKLRKHERVSRDTVQEERDKLIKKALDAHHFNARLLLTFDVDACKLFKMSRAQSILEEVGKDDRICRICHKDLDTSHTLRSHIASIHLKKTKHTCEVCGKCYGEKSSLTAHMNTHIGKMLKCDQCDKEYGSKSQLNEHKQSHLTAQERGSVCENCGKEFKHKRGWRGHIKTCGVALEDRERKKCKYCPMDFTTDKERRSHVFKEHREMHDADKARQPQRCLKCKLCDEEFTNAKEKAKHIRTVHKKPKQKPKQKSSKK